MHFPRFWTRARTGEIVTWGWSDISETDALKKAQERQARLLNWIREGKGQLDRYGYPDRPMREEVLREFRAPDGKHIGTVSRNSAGCHVLNTNGLLFVDVDTPEQASGGGVLGRLFGRKQIDPQTKTEEDAAATAQHWVQSNPEWGWRLYRTKAGVRLMAVHRPIDPSDSLVQRVFDAFKADSLYRKLCENQGCYRARLTPKPWRCGVARVPDRWPWKSVTTEQAFRNWDVEYTAQSRRFATCRFLNAFGRGAIAPEFNELVAFHDEHAQSSANLPLA